MSNLRKLALAATPGPWDTVRSFCVAEEGHIVEQKTHRVLAAHAKYFDAAFIAKANPRAILALLDELVDKDAQLIMEFELIERVEKIVSRMETLPQSLAYTRGIAAEFRDALQQDSQS